MTRRLYELCEARALVSQPHVSFFVPVDDVKRLYNEYRSRTKGTKIVLQHREDGHYFVVPYTTRFDDGYKMSLSRRRRAWIEEARNYYASLFLTLTVDPKQVTCLAHARKMLEGDWHKLVTVMYRDFAKQNSTRFRFDGSKLKPFYVKTFEFQRSGNIHLHAIICGVRRIDAEWLLSVTHGRNRLERIRHGAKGAINYVTKYIMKGVGEDNVNAILAWALWLHVFSLSRSLNICNKRVPRYAELTMLVWGFVPPRRPKYVMVAKLEWLPDDCVGFLEYGSDRHMHVFEQLLLEL